METRTFQSRQSSIDAGEAPRVLLSRLIDYAELFPPASLGMAAAVANYDAYLHSEHSWMLGRFIVPVARLAEFEEAVGRLSPAQAEAAWSLSALSGPSPAADLARIRESNDRFAVSHSARRARIESLEVKISSAEEIERLSKLIPAELDTYFEIPWAGGAASSGLRDCIMAVAHCGRRAKIRTGGETADKFPASEIVVEFIRLCAASSVAFKATAGLHHPVRSLHHLTYQPDSASTTMHGFLNVFLAAAFLRVGMDPRLAVELLNEQSATAFHFDPDGLLWREHRLGLDDISAARRDFAVSFGSCSFTEPVDDLRVLGLL
jgi:translation initiation factor 2 beta subunit (eIF-2beta)/eIF-5